MAFKSISQQLLAKMWQFSSLSPKGHVSVNIYIKDIKLKEYWKILKLSAAPLLGEIYPTT
jgi:hypothetical protein